MLRQSILVALALGSSISIIGINPVWAAPGSLDTLHAWSLTNCPFPRPLNIPVGREMETVARLNRVQDTNYYTLSLAPGLDKAYFAHVNHKAEKVKQMFMIQSGEPKVVFAGDEFNKISLVEAIPTGSMSPEHPPIYEQWLEYLTLNPTYETKLESCLASELSIVNDVQNNQVAMGIPVAGVIVGVPIQHLRIN